jgi:hypothetical protein
MHTRAMAITAATAALFTLTACESSDDTSTADKPNWR